MKKEGWIKLDSGIHDTLKGKVIDMYAFHKGYHDSDDSHLIIKFTDGTFICVGIETDDYDVCRELLDNKSCPEINRYRTIPHFIDITGKFHLEEFLEERIKMGIIEPVSQETIDEILTKEQEERRNRRYQEYLKLKEEFGE
jgi:hypothetical protein